MLLATVLDSAEHHEIRIAACSAVSLWDLRLFTPEHREVLVELQSDPRLDEDDLENVEHLIAAIDEANEEED